MSQEKQSNIIKYEAYKSMKKNLMKAMKAEFYYQAIFIEYAIIEDRCESVLRHAGVKTTEKNKNGEQIISLEKKLNKMEKNPMFAIPYVRKRITLDLISDIRNWKKERNDLVHDLAKIPYNPESLKDIAVKGVIIINTLDNKVKSVNRYHDKQQSRNDLERKTD